MLHFVRNHTRALLVLLLAGAALLACAATSGAPDAVTPDGGRYYGALVDGLRQGRGRVEWDNGTRYEGGFERGVYSGKGRYEADTGDVYEGDFERGQFSGTGTLLRKDGSRHEGRFDKWVPAGEGRYTDTQGNVFEGTFVNGELQGSGRITSKDGARYEGELERGRPQGRGTLRMANGDVYTGGFAFGQFEGQGTLTYATARRDGRTQESGVWRNGRLGGANREADEALARVNAEAALYNQRALLTRAVDALAPRDPGRSNLYLLAVAGDGSQEVFHREVDFVRDYFERRFHIAGHTLALVNSRNTVNTAPMATTTSIREALKAIAAHMDRDEDILFVFLTSHGSRSHGLTLNQDGIDLPDLPARELARMIADTGIRWKAIVVSACYSGGFIDPLKDERTLIITAARGDRTSFGCADEAEFTDFGRAYFKEALPSSGSFQEAFRKATALVDAWETQDGRTGPDERSLPQMDNPPQIERKLERWWRQAAQGRG
jgi:hypothetical protein